MSAEAIGLIVFSMTVLLHLVGTIWWAATLTKRVEHIERWISHNEQAGERLASLEQQVNNISEMINRIERHILKH